MIRLALELKSLTLTAIALLITGLGFGLAQYSGFTNINYAAVNAFHSTQLLAAQSRIAQRALDRVSQPSTGVAPQVAPQTSFRPASKRLLVQGFAQSLSDQPEQVRELTRAFTEGFKAFEQEATRLGKPNNVAMALTYLIGVCYLVHYGDEPTEAALLNLQGRLDGLFGASATFKQLSNQDRQKLYETMILMATLPLAGYTVATEQRDQALLSTYRKLAGDALESALGVRPERLKFTATSLERR